MDSATITVLTVTLVSMVFSAFFSGMEIAFISSNKVRVGIDTQKGGITSRIIDTFYNHSDMFISTMLVGNNIMLVVYGMGMAKLCEPWLCSLLGGSDVLVRQIAGAIARRIVTYVEPGDKVCVEQHMGFIKFGSRVDIFLPLDTEILVKLGDKTMGGVTQIARLKQH